MNLLEKLRRTGLDGHFFVMTQDGDQYKVIDIKEPPAKPRQWFNGPRPSHWAKPGTRPRPVSKERRDEAERMFLAGARYKEIRAALRINYVCLQPILKELEAKYPDKAKSARPQFWTPEQDAKLLQMRKDGYSQRRMAMELGRSIDAVQTRIRNHMRGY